MPGAVAFQGFQLVTGNCGQIAHRDGPVNVNEFAERNLFDGLKLFRLAGYLARLEGRKERRPGRVPSAIRGVGSQGFVKDILAAKEILEHDGHNVQVADGGLTGLDAFRLAAERGRSFDVVITDLGMPYLDGREVAKTLKNESPKTPVVMLTGWGAFMKNDGTVPVEVDGEVVGALPVTVRVLPGKLSVLAPEAKK